MPHLSVPDSAIHHEDSGTVGGGRLLAPDMIGFGSSGKPDIAYSFVDQAATWTHGSAAWFSST